MVVIIGKTYNAMKLKKKIRSSYSINTLKKNFQFWYIEIKF
jgi:hypothetical protein